MAEPLAVHERPHRTVAHDNASLGEFRRQRPQRDIRRCLHAFEDEGALSCEQHRALAAHRLGRGAARRPRPLCPFDDARHADTEGIGHRPARLPAINGATTRSLRSRE